MEFFSVRDKTIEKKTFDFHPIFFILKNMFVRFMICPVND